ncbi:MAG: SDR family oxidoreductase [Sedimentisphaerales bacterium]|nr:SDR family oxidoreductase [Sedimentisphaerales bacterium]
MDEDLFDLSGRTALVTGASRGIGRALAEGLAKYSADLALVARSEDQLLAAKQQISTLTGRRVWIFPADLSRLDSIQDLFEQVIDKVGSVDILVNAAGTTIRRPSEQLQPADLEAVMAVNLNAPLLLSQALFRHCKDRGRPGRIINVASLLFHAARPTIAAYTASKMALVGLTRTLAVEWACHRINVNAIAPGYIRTDLTLGLQRDPEFDRWVISNTPLGRWGLPSDLIGTAVLLASRAGEFITGQVLFVDGGWSAML